MVTITRHQIARVLPLLIATLVVGVGAYFVCVSALNELQTSQGEYVARSFGKYLVQEVPDLHGIVNGQVGGGAPVDALAGIRPIGSVFKFRIYDMDGLLKVDSSPFAAGHLVKARDAFTDSTARRVAGTEGSSFVLRRGDGKFLPLYYSEVTVPLVADNRVVGALSVLSDETEAWPDLLSQLRSVIVQVIGLILVAFIVPVVLYVRKLAQLELTRRRLRHTARHDELTGTLSRRGFVQALAEQIAIAGRDGLSIGIHAIDLDRFKDVNDAAGHAIGDEVLKQVSTRLRRLLGGHGQTARLGADEFAILQPLHRGGPSVAELAAAAVHALAEPMLIDGRTITVGASIGHASFPDDGRDAEELMRAATVALNRAKLFSRGSAVSFDRTMETARRARQRIDARLRTALATGGFELDFQPVFETASGRLRGFEALLRLADEDGQSIPPADFIPVAEENGLIGEVGLWALGEACRTARHWPDELFVAVNLSPAQFTSGTMAARVAEVLASSGLQPHRLELEVTESLLITDTEQVLQQLQDIRALGPSLALDDFGTGYSSLSYLWRFPFDKLKIDRSFMADLTIPGAKSREIIATIIALGRVLNLTITAEGVETEAQAAILRALGCDTVQGYLFGRPQRAIDVPATILRAFGVSVASGAPPPSAARHAGRR